MKARSTPEATVRLRFQGRLLGGCVLHYNGRLIPEAAFRRRRSLFLLLQLLLAPNHRLTRDQVLDLLWPEAEPEAAAAGLRVVLSDLRAACTAGSDDPSPVARRLDLIVLDPALDLDLDTIAFEQAAESALRDGGVDMMRAALDLHGGPLLPDLPYEDWVAGPRRRFADLHERLLLALVAAETATDPLGAETHLRALLALDPTREDQARDLLRLLTAMGKRAEVRRVYEDLNAALRDELDVDPAPETTALYAALRALPDTPPTPARTGRLPNPVTTLIGRDRELAALIGLLDDPATGPVGDPNRQSDPTFNPRLLTLTGAGGIGKTRLALAVAAEVRDRYPGGVWLVELAAIQDPRFVPRAAAAALEVREEHTQALTDTLTERLGDKTVLLVLDNCEHLVDACADLAATLLAACPGLRILATSRERFNMAGELAWRVPPLGLPPVPERPDQAPRFDELAGAEAVRLFVDRARLAQPGFVLTESNALLTARICRSLDGIPLALELAAARLSVLPIEGITARLDDRFRLLTGGNRTALPRHQTLRATLDWSYTLLTEEERTLLRRLAIFTGGWTLEAADGICAAAGDPLVVPDLVWEPLAGLVHKSLVLLDNAPVAGEQRYHMLETVRQYALEHLIAGDEASALLVRYEQWYLALAERAAPELIGAHRQQWLRLLEDDVDNVRAVLSWTLARQGPLAATPQAPDPEIALRLVVALWRFWDVRGYWSEGRRWVDMALALQGAPPLGLRAAALNAAGSLANNQGDFREAEALWEQSLVLKREDGDPRNIAAALNNLSIAVQRQGNYERSVALLEESLALKREIDDRTDLPHSLNNLGITVQHMGDLDRAVALYEEAATLWRDLGDDLNSAYAQLNLGVALTRLGQPMRATALYEETLVVFRRLDESWGIAAARHNLGNLAAAQGDYARAADLYRESLRLWRYLADKEGLAENLESWAALASAERRYADAVRLHGAAQAYRLQTGAPARPADRAKQDEQLTAARTALGAAAYDEAWAAGQALTIEQALESVQ
jgi:predicted ATPase/DNA-binding SARP family transcriptional activator